MSKTSRRRRAGIACAAFLAGLSGVGCKEENRPGAVDQKTTQKAAEPPARRGQKIAAAPSSYLLNVSWLPNGQSSCTTNLPAHQQLGSATDGPLTLSFIVPPTFPATANQRASTAATTA